MSVLRTVGSPERPVRVAIVGAGPAGFFTAAALLEREHPVFSVDVFERLPTPFGLVRTGVAPDHQKIKGVTKTFEKTARHGRFRFLGNVEIGRDVSQAELAAHYDQVVYAVGSPNDRRLGIPGEELRDCHAATAFVGWYNAHPDFRDFPFDLSARRAIVIGVGNVALDIARVLLRGPDELASTDIASHALERLRTSAVREVVIAARRGPAEVAFTPAELRDLAGLSGVAVSLEAAAVEAEAGRLEALDPATRKNVALLLSLARAEPRAANRTLRFEFCASPVEVLDDGQGRVRGLRFERNELVRGPDGTRVRATGQYFELDAGLVFRAIGYVGVPLPGVPFDASTGTIPNVDGRVSEFAGGPVRKGTYAVGWVRRGPLGVIGTNKADGALVAQCLAEDVPGLERVSDRARTHATIDALLARRDVRVTSYEAWSALDAAEVATGQARGKVREKFTSVEAMMNALLRAAPRRGDVGERQP